MVKKNEFAIFTTGVTNVTLLKTHTCVYIRTHLHTTLASQLTFTLLLRV